MAEIGKEHVVILCIHTKPRETDLFGQRFRSPAIALFTQGHDDSRAVALRRRRSRATSETRSILEPVVLARRKAVALSLEVKPECLRRQRVLGSDGEW